MNLSDKQKNIIDYTLAGVGTVAGVAAAAFVVAEIPAIIVAGGAAVVAGSAIKRINKREEL